MSVVFTVCALIGGFFAAVVVAIMAWQMTCFGYVADGQKILSPPMTVALFVVFAATAVGCLGAL